jgi:hypothetical protein
MGENKKYPIGGYAPGNYQNECVSCGKIFMGDKLARQCEQCAILATTIEFINPSMFDEEKFIVILKGSYKAKDGTTKRALLYHGKYYAPKDDIIGESKDDNRLDARDVDKAFEEFVAFIKENGYRVNDSEWDW